MLFTSLVYIILLAATFVVSQNTPASKRWIVLLVFSALFYGYGNAWLVALLYSVIVVQYCIARLISTSQTSPVRKFYLALSTSISLSLLLFFKYGLFMLENLWPTTESFVVPATVHTVFFDMILPLGISFFTFQTLGYVIDVYRGDTKPEKHLGKFALFVSYFPQLIAGPIERANYLLPQLTKPREYNYETATLGLQLMLWGFFKKLVIADRIALIIDPLFVNPDKTAGWQVVVAAVLFYMQIYCDFSGYIDIARGSSRMLGIELSRNFKRPYMATSVRNFWRRWNITLSEWFRDYLYIPLGGSRAGATRACMNVLFVFLLSGMWHGTGWNFLMWGLLHGIWICIEIAIRHVYKTMNIDQLLPTILLRMQTVTQWFVTYVFCCVSFLIFRIPSLGDFATIMERGTIFRVQQLLYFVKSTVKVFDASVLGISLFCLVCVEILFELSDKSKQERLLTTRMSWCICAILLFAILNFGIYSQKEFIYFQF